MRHAIRLLIAIRVGLQLLGTTVVNGVLEGLNSKSSTPIWSIQDRLILAIVGRKRLVGKLPF
jgi:hypothetical protein